MAGNENNDIDSLEIEVTEIPDGARPTLDQAGKTHDEGNSSFELHNQLFVPDI